MTTGATMLENEEEKIVKEAQLLATAPEEAWLKLYGPARTWLGHEHSNLMNVDQLRKRMISHLCTEIPNFQKASSTPRRC